MQIHLVSLDSRTLGEVWKEEEGKKECKGREGVGEGNGEEWAEEKLESFIVLDMHQYWKLNVLSSEICIDITLKVESWKFYCLRYASILNLRRGEEARSEPSRSTNNPLRPDESRWLCCSEPELVVFRSLSGSKSKSKGGEECAKPSGRDIVAPQITQREQSRARACFTK